MADCCTLHKILLVLFFHPKALLSLPRCSCSTDTGSTRAPLKTAYAGQHRASAMEYTCMVEYWSSDKFLIPVTQVFIIYGCGGTVTTSSYLDEVYTKCTTDEEKAHALADVYISSRPESSWQHHVQTLYGEVELTTAKEAKSFLQQNGG